jgi:hypothetical protein
MSHLVKENEALDPLDVSRFGTLQVSTAQTASLPVQFSGSILLSDE